MKKRYNWLIWVVVFFAILFLGPNLPVVGPLIARARNGFLGLLTPLTSLLRGVSLPRLNLGSGASSPGGGGEGLGLSLQGAAQSVSRTWQTDLGKWVIIGVVFILLGWAFVGGIRRVGDTVGRAAEEAQSQTRKALTPKNLAWLLVLVLLIGVIRDIAVNGWTTGLAIGVVPPLVIMALCAFLEKFIKEAKFAEILTTMAILLALFVYLAVVAGYTEGGAVVATAGSYLTNLLRNNEAALNIGLAVMTLLAIQKVF